MVAGVFEDHVVVAANIKHVKVGIIDFPVAVPCAESLRDGARRVAFQYCSLQQLRRMHHADVLPFYYLVAQTPSDNRRVIAVSHHHGLDILAVARVNHR